ncbi:hypothetical protein [Bdellovibrio sp. BCCA]|uniref:hypothetical protein n=1 Tax=Bdellovibrio sp. BCCA TaxID=3136281 RepID=UPI0030F0B0D6
MKNMIVLILILFTSLSAFASKKEFLKKIENGEELQKGYMLSGVSQNIQRLVIQKHKGQFPKFKENMLYVHQWDDGDVIHVIRYLWDDNECSYTYFVKNQDFSKAPKQLSEVTTPSPMGGVRQVIDANAEKVDMKYCRSLYGF